MDVALFITWDQKDVWIKYSDDPALVKAWMENEETLVTDELVQHIVSLGHSTDPDNVREELLAAYTPDADYWWYARFRAIIWMLPDMKSISEQGFKIKEQYQLVSY